jgi:hypothetical protein
VQDIIAGLGLTQMDFSIGGGRVVHVPKVVSMAAGPPVGLDIKILPGQSPEDFSAHERTIAYDLGVAEVRVVPPRARPDPAGAAAPRPATRAPADEPVTTSR